MGIGVSDGGNGHPDNQQIRHLVAPDHSALLIQEMQNGVVGSGSGLRALADAASAVSLARKAGTVARAARSAGVTLVHCTAENLPGGFGSNHNARVFETARRLGLENEPGSESVRPIVELAPEAEDLVFPRFHGLSPMSGSALDPLLRNSGITTVVVIGVSLNIAIPNLVFDAVNRSYQVVVVSDAVVGAPIEYGRQVVEHALALVATIVTADELIAAWGGE